MEVIRIASIREVARMAQVAPCTVSRALNNSGYVSEETRKKIIKAVETLDYVPNQWIRNLYHQSTGIIGVVIPDIAHPFFSTLSSCLLNELRKHGYNMMLCSTGTDKNREKEYLGTLERNMFDGVIAGVAMLSDEFYMQIKKPYILLDRKVPNIPLVCSDYRKGGMLAAEKMLADGRKHVLQLCSHILFPTPSYESQEVFAQFLQDHNVNVLTVKLDLWSTMKFEDCFENAQKILQQHPEIDGVFGADLHAVAFLKAAMHLQKKIPQDLSIVSFDGTYVADMGIKSLTTVVQDIQKIAQKTVQVLLRKINGMPIKEDHYYIPLQIRDGESTLK